MPDTPYTDMLERLRYELGFYRYTDDDDFAVEDTLLHYRSRLGITSPSHDNRCPRCQAVVAAGAQPLAEQVVSCIYCGNQGFLFGGGHGSDNCPTVYLCVCGNRHRHGRPPCVYCGECSRVHYPPECCHMPYATSSLVVCMDCGGHHIAPVCGDIEIFRRCVSGGCDSCNRMIDQYEDTIRDRRDDDEDYDSDDDMYGVGDLLHHYDYRPVLLMRGDGPLWLGMELELEVNDQRNNLRNVLGIAQETFGDFVYFKSDGSLTYGFEMVSHPATFPWWIENFNWQGLRTLSQSGCRTTQGTGIHIHVNREAFTGASHSYRWLKFWYRNPREIQAIAHRTSSWAAFSDDERRGAKYYCKPIHRYNDYVDSQGRSLRPQRYSAVNVSNPTTYEVRVFRATMTIRRVQAFLGLVDASVRYTQQLTVPAIRNGGWEMPAFREWVNEQGDLYRPLSREMEECI